jgi:hypothetical protein
MNRLQIIVGGAFFMVPAISAPNVYLTRLGPKPLNFGATPRPLEEVIAKLPTLYTDLPPKSVASSHAGSSFTNDDPFYLWPVPSASTATNPLEDFPRLPDNWVKSRLGSELPATTSGEPNYPTPEDGTTNPTIRPPTSLSPESLIRFFTTPGSQQNSGIAIPVPFIPGMPSTPTSSRAVFRQD